MRNDDGARPKHRVRRRKMDAKSFDEIVDALPSIKDADADPLKNIQAAEFYPHVEAAWQDFCETRKHVYEMSLAGYLNFKSAFYFAFAEGILSYCCRCGLDGDEGKAFCDELNAMAERFNEELNDKVRQHMELDYEHMGAPLRELSREHGHDKVRDAAIRHSTRDVDALRRVLAS
jgi:polyhydroxyalkanoate synthesis regulator phasin